MHPAAMVPWYLCFWSRVIYQDDMKPFRCLTPSHGPPLRLRSSGSGDARVKQFAAAYRNDSATGHVQGRRALGHLSKTPRPPEPTRALLVTPIITTSIERGSFQLPTAWLALGSVHSCFALPCLPLLCSRTTTPKNNKLARFPFSSVLRPANLDRFDLCDPPVHRRAVAQQR